MEIMVWMAYDGYTKIAEVSGVETKVEANVAKLIAFNTEGNKIAEFDWSSIVGWERV